MRLTIPEEVLSRELDGEMVLLDLRSGRYFGLNATASRVWDMLKAEIEADAMAQALVEEFEVSAERAHADITAFVTVLVDRGLAYPAREARV